MLSSSNMARTMNESRYYCHMEIKHKRDILHITKVNINKLNDFRIKIHLLLVMQTNVSLLVLKMKMYLHVSVVK